MKVTVPLTLDSEQDKDIIRWLERQRPRGRAAAIRAAIRAGWSSSDPGAVESKLDRVLALLERGITIQSDNGGEPQDEPVEAAAHLDKLGL